MTGFITESSTCMSACNSTHHSNCEGYTLCSRLETQNLPPGREYRHKIWTAPHVCMIGCPHADYLTYISTLHSPTASHCLQRVYQPDKHLRSKACAVSTSKDTVEAKKTAPPANSNQSTSAHTGHQHTLIAERSAAAPLTHTVSRGICHGLSGNVPMPSNQNPSS
jgi:hypothetical protein